MIPDWITAVTALIALLLSLVNTYTLVRREMRLGLIAPRLEAYRKLWKHMDLASPSRILKDPTKGIEKLEKDAAKNLPKVEREDLKKTLTKKEFETIENNLRCWYYREGDGGNGIFLSNKAGEKYREALKALLNARAEDAEDAKSTIAVSSRLSELRSRTKKDIAVFGRWEK